MRGAVGGVARRIRRAGGVRRGMPAWRNSCSMSDGQYSNTSRRVPAAIRRAHGAAGHADRCRRAVQLADADRRLARDVPGVRGARAVGVRQVAAVGADLDAGHAGRRQRRRRRVVGPRQVHGVGDAEEQRRRGVGADERRVALRRGSCRPRPRARRGRRRRPSRRRGSPTTCRSSTRPASACAAASVPSPSGPRVVAQHVERDERGLGAEQADALRLTGRPASTRSGRSTPPLASIA